VSQGDFLAYTLPTLYSVHGGEKELERALDSLCKRASWAIEAGYSILILSDRGIDADSAPIPSLLALTAVHNHLIREGSRTRVALVDRERRTARSDALLPADRLRRQCDQSVPGDRDLGKPLAARPPERAVRNVALKHFKKADQQGPAEGLLEDGHLHAAELPRRADFRGDRLNKRCRDRSTSPGTPSRIEGVGLEVLAQGSQDEARPRVPSGDGRRRTELDVGGTYQYRVRGEYHLLNPQTVSSIQKAVRTESYATYKEYSKLINEQSEQLCTLRGLLKFKQGTPIPVDDVEPAKEIVKRFATGAMSFGSISKEAHETLAIAMNRMGARSNTGEGGEDEERFKLLPNGDSKRSSIKQVASGRFGVTTNYLVNADELQIKVAQGAKPGEGGQLPGHKVDEFVAKVRHSIPGVGLISPPPHHDIYSIEDLAQLIYDLKNVNPQARISVKLVSEVGVGTVAAGVSKAHADLVLIAGDSGGTGASPLTSLRHAGIPWELGLAETQQVLVMNDLRSRIRVQTDGKLQTGRDVVIGGLLGAEEFGFSTAPLVAMGCIMMRKCHLNTCPVGIATQDPALRAKFHGTPEHVINFFFFIAEEVREIMAQLGFRTFDEMVGRVDMLEMRDVQDHWKAKGLDLSSMLFNPPVPKRVGRRCSIGQDHGLEEALDHKLIELAQDALENKTPVEFKLPIRNVHRTVGAMLSGEVAKRYGSEPAAGEDDSDQVQRIGRAELRRVPGAGIHLELEGDANDYVGKGMSGGQVVVYPPRTASFVPEENILIGNVVLYGATSGEAFFNGMAGERFAVRNSGATAVVEGVGDHGCEYMTKGLVVDASARPARTSRRV
jgi:glutamate synthase (NADPH) large chain